MRGNSRSLRANIRRAGQCSTIRHHAAPSFQHARANKEGEPGIQNHVTYVGPRVKTMNDDRG